MIDPFKSSELTFYAHILTSLYMLELDFFFLKNNTTENISEMSYFPLYKNLQFKLLHFFTLIGTDDHCFLGATLRDATSQIIRHHTNNRS